MIPKKIVILGIPGSGKSKFAIRLGRLLKIPVHHLDKHKFEKNIKRSSDDYLKSEKNITNSDEWITEGCSISTLENRFALADAVIYLSPSRYVCFWRVFKRQFYFDEDSKISGCLRIINWELLRYMWNFAKEKKPKIDMIRQKYPLVDFRILENTAEIEKYFKELETCLLNNSESIN